ncbi:MAG: hypothetical protein ABIH65_02730 [Nanoarchaeota archaeon]
MNKKRKFRRKIGTIALLQIIILIASIIAFSYLVGESLLVVSADPDGPGEKKATPSNTNTPSFLLGISGLNLAKEGYKGLGSVGTPGLGGAGGAASTSLAEAGAVGGEAASITVGSVITNAGYAAAIYAVISFGLQLLGVDSSLANKIGGAGAIGYFFGWLSAQKGIGIAEWVGQGLGIGVGLAALGIGLVVGLIVFILFGGFTKEDTRIVQFTCELWDAPSGGSNCEKCNDGILPCTEYRCASLGQSCELVNKGTDEELCIWVSRDDIKPPIIQAWLKTLTTEYQYTPNNAISPPNRGVKIVPQGNTKGCIAAFTPLRFGVTLDEPAKCKISTTRAISFDEMENKLLSGGASLYNHSYQLSLPGAEALASENLTLPTGGELSLYVKCQDENGNSNTADFVFSLCVDEGPDTTPPMIMSTSILNNMPIAFNQESVDLSVYINEPAECRWSKTDLGYDDMENNMNCNTGVLQMNAQGLYECKTTLTGLENRVDNIFYFRCKDQPWLVGTDESSRNANEQSYKFVLKGTEPLYILSAKPNETTMRDSTNVIKVTLEVETSAGYNKGQAMCYHEGYGTNGNFNEFYTTNSYKHSQDLYLPEGDYTYNIRCVDLGGNADNTVVTFNVETDNEPPIVVRVYHDEQSLKIITNENATCVYSTESMECEYGFDDGIEMETSSNGRIHSTKWDKSKTFYIKCQDDFGNRALPDQCNIIAKPFEVA